MVAFNDRRHVDITDPKAVSRGMHLDPGENVSRRVINGRFVVKSSLQEDKSVYSVHEALPSGEVIERERNHATRYEAKKSARAMTPTTVREL